MSQSIMLINETPVKTMDTKAWLSFPGFNILYHHTSVRPDGNTSWFEVERTMKVLHLGPFQTFLWMFLSLAGSDLHSFSL